MKKDSRTPPPAKKPRGAEPAEAVSDNDSEEHFGWDASGHVFYIRILDESAAPAVVEALAKTTCFNRFLKRSRSLRTILAQRSSQRAKARGGVGEGKIEDFGSSNPGFGSSDPGLPFIAQAFCCPELFAGARVVDSGAPAAGGVSLSAIVGPTRDMPSVPTSSSSDARAGFSRRESATLADDNNHFEYLARQEPIRQARNEGRNQPASYQLPRACLHLCGEHDITEQYLKSINGKPLVVTCKDRRVAKDHACRMACIDEPILFNIGHKPSRDRDWWPLLRDLIDFLNAGQDVILHCHAGVHRAALCACFVLMFGLQIRFDQARQMIEEQRNTRLDEILHADQRNDGS